MIIISDVGEKERIQHYNIPHFRQFSSLKHF